MRFASSSRDRFSGSEVLSSAAFAVPVWLWCDPDRHECGKTAIDTVDDAKAALYWSALAHHRHEGDGRVRCEWLATFIAIDRAKHSMTAEAIETARRMFRDLAEASGNLVKVDLIRSQGIRRSATAGESALTAPRKWKALAEDRKKFLAKTRNAACSTRMTQGTAMKNRHRVRINGEEFWVSNEEVLLDGALRNGIDIPHDCRSGQCGKCRVRTLKGKLFTVETRGVSDDVHACQSRVVSDVTVAVDALPDLLSTSGEIAYLRDVSPEVVEVLIVPSSPVTILPGQYLNVSFDGFPARSLCPTVCLDDPSRADGIYFHIRRVKGGRVSAALGNDIAAGHRAKLIGPFGSAHLQPGLASRLVLVAEDTGFAPIWSIAAVALQEQPDRRIDLVVGAKGGDFYMEPALRWLAGYPNVTVTFATSQDLSSPDGSPADHLPDLLPDDVVHVAGPPATVHTVMRRAETAGAVCFAQAFAASDHLTGQPSSESLLGSWGLRRSRPSSRGPKSAGAARSWAGVAQEPGGRLRRGVDFYLRCVAAGGAFVACSGLLLGALLPLDSANVPGSLAEPANPALARGISEVSAQTSVQLEQDRQWAVTAAENDTDGPLRAGANEDATEMTDAARDLAVAGVWASEVSACSPGQNRKRLIPAVITADGASAGDTFCAFKKKRPTETGMDVVANCSNSSKRWTAKVRLTVNGNRLTWSSHRGTQAYLRCEPSVRMADAR